MVFSMLLLFYNKAYTKGECFMQSNDLMLTLPSGIYPRFDWLTTVWNNTSLQAVFDFYNFTDDDYDSELDFLDLQSQFFGGLPTFNIQLKNGCRIFLKKLYVDMTGLHRLEDLLHENLPEIRVDFSGKTLSYLGYSWQFEFIRKKLPFTAHLTRVDFAFDFINFAPDLLQNFYYFLNDPKNLSSEGRLCCHGQPSGYSFKTSWGDKERLIYIGSPQSSRMLRIYDKYLQNTKKGVFSPPDHLTQFTRASTWLRLELQLRDRECEKWLFGFDEKGYTPCDLDFMEGCFKKIFETYSIRDCSGRSKLGIPDFWVNLCDWSNLPTYMLNLSFVKTVDNTARVIDAAERAVLPFIAFVARFGMEAWRDLVFDKIYSLNQMEDEYTRRKMLSLLRKLSECSDDSLTFYRDRGVFVGNTLNASYFLEVNKK